MIFSISNGSGKSPNGLGTLFGEHAFMYFGNNFPYKCSIAVASKYPAVIQTISPNQLLVLAENLIVFNKPHKKDDLFLSMSAEGWCASCSIPKLYIDRDSILFNSFQLYSSNISAFVKTQKIYERIGAEFCDEYLGYDYNSEVTNALKDAEEAIETMDSIGRTLGEKAYPSYLGRPQFAVRQDLKCATRQVYRHYLVDSGLFEG